MLGCSLIFDPFPNIRSKNDVGTSIPVMECVHCEAALPVAFFLVIICDDETTGSRLPPAAICTTFRFSLEVQISAILVGTLALTCCDVSAGMVFHWNFDDAHCCQRRVAPPNPGLSIA